VIVSKTNRKPLINFLVRRWLLFSGLAAEERIYVASCQHAKTNHLPTPEAEPAVIEIQPCRQIEIIKQHIIAIMPEAKFIDYMYESPAPLNPNDFAELCIADHRQCANKVKALIERIEPHDPRK